MPYQKANLHQTTKQWVAQQAHMASYGPFGDMADDTPLTPKGEKLRQLRERTLVGRVINLGTRTEKTKQFYTHAEKDQVLALMARKPCMKHGIPVKFAQDLLTGIKAERSRKVANYPVFTYRLPFWIKKKAGRCRTSHLGVLVLKQWADKHYAFSKFYDLYRDDECEADIEADCIQLAIGVLPQKYLDAERWNEWKLKEIEAEEEAQRQIEREKRKHLYANQMAAAPYTGSTLQGYGQYQANQGQMDQVFKQAIAQAYHDGNNQQAHSLMQQYDSYQRQEKASLMKQAIPMLKKLAPF